MKKIALDQVAAAMSFLGGAVKMMQINRSFILQGRVSAQHIDLETYAHMVKSIEAIQGAALAMDMVATKAASGRAHKALVNSYRQHGQFGSEILGSLIDPVLQTISAFHDELEGRLVVALTTKYADLFESTDPTFGDNVDAAFPLAAEDLNEAASCLALGRATACVFHLMRAMEYAVQRLSQCLGIENISREWGKLLSDIAKAIEAMPKGAGRDSWSESHILLYHVKQAWRNDVMHPKKTYTQAEAEKVFEAVRSYLVQLSCLINAHN